MTLFQHGLGLYSCFSPLHQIKQNFMRSLVCCKMVNVLNLTAQFHLSIKLAISSVNNREFLLPIQPCSFTIMIIPPFIGLIITLPFFFFLIYTLKPCQTFRDDSQNRLLTEQGPRRSSHLLFLMAALVVTLLSHRVLQRTVIYIYSCPFISHVKGKSRKSFLFCSQQYFTARQFFSTMWRIRNSV